MKIDFFFQIFVFKTFYFLLKYFFHIEIAIFEVSCVGISQEIGKGDGGEFVKNCPFRPLSVCLFFELHQHAIPQKNTFLMQKNI